MPARPRLSAQIEVSVGILRSPSPPDPIVSPPHASMGRDSSGPVSGAQPGRGGARIRFGQRRGGAPTIDIPDSSSQSPQRRAASHLHRLALGLRAQACRGHRRDARSRLSPRPKPGDSVAADLRMARRLARVDLRVRAAFVLERPSIDCARARRPGGTVRAPALVRAREFESAPHVARPLRHRRARVRRAGERAELRHSLERAPVAEISFRQRAPRALESATVAGVAQANAGRNRPLAGDIVVRAGPSPAVDELPVEEPPTMATTTASLALRATTAGRIALLTVRAAILLVCAVRSGLRERWNDGQSEDDRSDKDGLTKNLASRRVCEL